MKNFKSKFIKGLTLIELFLALAIIAIIWVMATRYYQTVYLSSQVNQALSIIQALRGASAQFAAGKPGYTGLSMSALDTSRLIPSDLGTGTGTNPWGGNITIGPAGSGDAQISITMTSVPAAACANLQNKFTGQTVSFTCNGGSLTAQFS